MDLEPGTWSHEYVYIILQNLGTFKSMMKLNLSVVDLNYKYLCLSTHTHAHIDTEGEGGHLEILPKINQTFFLLQSHKYNSATILYWIVVT